MTTLKEVEAALHQLTTQGNETAKRWINNDIMKMKLAMSYDAWMEDIEDHQYPMTLPEYIESCIEGPWNEENPPT
ncbi:hypothetical protein [Paenibacillus senegalimassiliensis]|uniref:hypothetical protein n=1 Tax=Paenibacillus senegalimassiliensis TaxID=1737426 RepID=UPI00073F8747|nr:hypothetical protein [Paenibacillus senegalimassiliensis]